MQKHAAMRPKMKGNLPKKGRKRKVRRFRKSYATELRDYRDVQSMCARNLRSNFQNCRSLLLKAEQRRKEAAKLIEEAQKLEYQYKDFQTHPEKYERAIKRYEDTAKVATSILNLPNERKKEITQFPCKLAIQLYLALRKGDLERVNEIFATHMGVKDI